MAGAGAGVGWAGLRLRQVERRGDRARLGVRLGGIVVAVTAAAGEADGEHAEERGSHPGEPTSARRVRNNVCGPLRSGANNRPPRVRGSSRLM